MGFRFYIAGVVAQVGYDLAEGDIYLRGTVGKGVVAEDVGVIQATGHTDIEVICGRAECPLPETVHLERVVVPGEVGGYVVSFIEYWVRRFLVEEDVKVI